MPDWLLFPLLLLALLALGVQRRRAMKKIMRNSGQRPDGSWEPGRAPSDMTAVGKTATVISLVAFTGIVVMRVADGGPGWLWGVAVAVIVACLLTVLLSERRRVRREGVDIGHGPGRLGPE